MGLEFTGERVVPGHVDRNLWNEHLARYAFAARLSHGRRVLDLGCGTAYGSDELAALALRVTALDLAPDAVQYAKRLWSRRNLEFTAGDAAALPFRDRSFDLVVAFEVLEHLANWRSLLSEARRVLAPGGQLMLSTPNKLSYTQSRAESGPNPYHEHEFEYQEFRDALALEFPHVSVFLQNHTEGLLFQSTSPNSSADVRFENPSADPTGANFFVAVCATTPQTGSPTFLYVPKTGNILSERENHIRKLQDELKKKSAWLDELQKEHSGLVELFRKQTADLEERNQWARDLDTKLQAAGERIAGLQKELEQQRAGYEAKIGELEQENQSKTEWAEASAHELEEKTAELFQAVEVLHATEKVVAERTAWAQRLDRELAIVGASRWVRLGRKIGVGPNFGNE